MSVGQVGWISRPVVHLDIDVDGVLAAPGWTVRIVPDALQIGGQGSHSSVSRGRYEEVTPKVEHQGRQLDVRIRIALVVGQSRVGGLVAIAARSEVEIDATHQARVVSDSRLLHLCVSLGHGGINSAGGYGTTSGNVTVSVDGLCVEEDVNGSRSSDADLVLRGGDSS